MHHSPPVLIMVGMADAVEDRIAHEHVVRRHVDACPKHVFAVSELSGAHASEEVEVLCNAAVAERALLAGLSYGTAVLANLLTARTVHISLACPDQLLRVLVEALEVIRGEVEVFTPVEAEPTDVLLNGAHVQLVFRLRVGVVEAQMSDTSVVGSGTEIEANRLGVTDVKVPVGLRRKASYHGAPVLAGGHVFGDDGADEIPARGWQRCGFCIRSWGIRQGPSWRPCPRCEPWFVSGNRGSRGV